jgi:hypothetical protein
MPRYVVERTFPAGVAMDSRDVHAERADPTRRMLMFESEVVPPRCD